MPPCPVEMREFVALERQRLLIPCRGDVDMIMGGPPCQGVSERGRERTHAIDSGIVMLMPMEL